MGFLHATPEGSNQSRAERLLDADKRLPLPTVIGGIYLQEALLECGPADIAMGEAPLQFSEIEAYARASGGLLPKEVRTVRAMSKAYLVAKQNGKDPFFIPPWDGSDD